MIIASVAVPVGRLTEFGRSAEFRRGTIDLSRGKIAIVTKAAASTEDPGRWRMLAIVGVAELLAMAPWFSASAVAPLLTAEWGLDRLGLPALTIAVQLGFAAGALALAVTAAADVLPARLLFFGGATLAPAANLGFAFLARDPGSALPFRVLTGLALAGVYPIGLKVLAGWFRRERGL